MIAKYCFRPKIKMGHRGRRKIIEKRGVRFTGAHHFRGLADFQIRNLSISHGGADRGQHQIDFLINLEAHEIAKGFCSAMYGSEGGDTGALDISPSTLLDCFYEKKIVWAPDGDQVFDDGSHVLQFDVGEKIRLIGFRNSDETKSMRDTVSEYWMKADEFYGILDRWVRCFNLERERMLNQGAKDHEL